MLKKVIICLVLGIGLVGLLACSTTPPLSNYLTEEEVNTLIENDNQLILSHFNSLAQTYHGKNYLADLYMANIEWQFILVWHEDGQYREKSISTAAGLTWEEVNQAKYHEITLKITRKDSPPGLYQWRIYPDGRVEPFGSNALRLEAELVK